MKQLLLLAFFVCLSLTARATHLLGGEIMAKNISGQTYEFSAIVYFDMANGAPAANSQKEIIICLGDGTQRKVDRLSLDLLVDNPAVSRGVYRTTYTYGAPGRYTVTARITQYSLGIINFPDGGQSQEMIVQTILNTSVPNSTALAPSPVFVSGLRQIFSLPMPHTDPDGDSLAYRIVKPLDQLKICAPTTTIDRYVFPNEVKREGIFQIVFQKAHLVWNAPAEVGVYAYAYVTEEWRKGIKITETWRTNVVTIKDLKGVQVTIPTFEPVLVDFNGTITALPPQEFLPSAVALKIYPNPSVDYITAEVSTRTPDSIIFELVDLQGRVLQRADSEETALSHTQVFETSHLAKGVYLIRVQSKDGTLTRKFVR